jgi:gliding motility-associated-like protein
LSCDAGPNPIFVAAETTELTLIGEDVYGCRDTVSLTITVEERKLEFELPNAFTPDGDGVNDRFRALYEGMPFKSFHLRIFSRWGEMVFETSNPATGWDGVFKGKPLPADVYAYWLVYTLADDAEGTEKGEVALMR